MIILTHDLNRLIYFKIYNKSINIIILVKQSKETSNRIVTRISIQTKSKFQKLKVNAQIGRVVPVFE